MRCLLRRRLSRGRPANSGLILTLTIRVSGSDHTIKGCWKNLTALPVRFCALAPGGCVPRLRYRPHAIVNNADGTSFLYTCNPTSTVTETVATYSAANATGTVISDVEDNANGTSLLYAYNPSSTVSLTASEYSGTATATGAPPGTLTCRNLQDAPPEPADEPPAAPPAQRDR
jgi:hypothetical protein